MRRSLKRLGAGLAARSCALWGSPVTDTLAELERLRASLRWREGEPTGHDSVLVRHADGDHEVMCAFSDGLWWAGGVWKRWDPGWRWMPIPELATEDTLPTREETTEELRRAGLDPRREGRDLLAMLLRACREDPGVIMRAFRALAAEWEPEDRLPLAAALAPEIEDEPIPPDPYETTKWRIAPRDPRIDPKPGDWVADRMVLSVDGERLFYVDPDGQEVRGSLSAWRKTVRGGDVQVDGMGRHVMLLCPECGNKRCPKAEDRRRRCSGSNALGQPMTEWEHAPSYTLANGVCGACNSYVGDLIIGTLEDGTKMCPECGHQEPGAAPLVARGDPMPWAEVSDFDSLIRYADEDPVGVLAWSEE